MVGLCNSNRSDSLGNFRSERAYRTYYDELSLNNEIWMAFFNERGNHEQTEHTCSILGILAIIYRQQGMFQDYEKVLDMELKVIDCCKRSTTEAPAAQIRYCDMLEYKMHIIRYNLYIQLERFQECVPLFRKLVLHEFRYQLDFDQQDFFRLQVFGNRVEGR